MTQEEQAVWDYVAERLPNLKIIGASMTCWNGGQTMETTFQCTNNAGIDVPLFFERNQHYAFVCPLDLSLFRCNPDREGKSRFTFRIGSLPYKGTSRTRGWVDHAAVILKYINPEARDWAEIAMLGISLEDKTSTLTRLWNHLRQVEAL